MMAERKLREKSIGARWRIPKKKFDMEGCMGCRAAQIEEDNVKCLISGNPYPKKCPYPNKKITEEFMTKKFEKLYKSPIHFWAGIKVRKR